MKDELHIDKEDLKIRKSWPDTFSPETKIHKVKTDYKRQNNKQEIQKALDEALDEIELDDADSYTE